MRAAVLHGSSLAAADTAKPEPGPGQVLVRTLACGICGSDLSHYHRRNPPQPGAEVPPDIVMGHEFCAEIVDYGPRTERRFKPGQIVCSVPILLDDGQANFIGYSPVIPGGYGEFMRLTEDHLIPVANSLSPDLAALTEPAAVGWRAVNRAQLGPDDVPLVMGCGPVGLAVIAALKLKRAHPVVAADFSPGRRALALALGADVVIDPAEQSPYEAWREMAQTGLPDPGPCLPGWLVGSGLKPAVIFECVGAKGLLDQIMKAAPQDARIVVVGLCSAADPIVPFIGVSKELTIIFSNSYGRAEFSDTLHHIAEGMLDVAPMITGKVGLGGVAQAFEDLSHPNHHAKILVEPWRA